MADRKRIVREVRSDDKCCSKCFSVGIGGLFYCPHHVHGHTYSYHDKRFYLHAMDRTRERAEAHKKMFQEVYRMKEQRAVVRIELIESDHAFAQAMKF